MPITPTGPESPVTIKDLFYEFQTQPFYKKLKPGTQEVYETAFKRTSKLHNVKLSELKRSKIKRVIDEYVERPGIQSKIISFYSRIISYAFDMDYIPVNVMARYPRPKLGSHKRVNQEKLKTIISAGDTVVTDLVTLLYNTGLRISDALALKMSAWDEAENVLRDKSIKTGEEVALEISDDLRALLQRRKSEGAGPDDYVLHLSSSTTNTSSARYNFVYARWHKALTSVGLNAKRITFHGIRKDMACRIIEGGGTDLHVQSVLGHSDIRQSAEYRKEAARRHIAKEALSLVNKTGTENK